MGSNQSNTLKMQTHNKSIHPIGTLFLYKYSENNIWSIILLDIKSNGDYLVEFDGIVVPDDCKDGSRTGPQCSNMMICFFKNDFKNSLFKI